MNGYVRGKVLPLYHSDTCALHVLFLMRNKSLILRMPFSVWGYYACPGALNGSTSTWDTTNRWQQILIAWNDISASCSPTYSRQVAVEGDLQERSARRWGQLRGISALPTESAHLNSCRCFVALHNSGQFLDAYSLGPLARVIPLSQTSQIYFKAMPLSSPTFQLRWLPRESTNLIFLLCLLNCCYINCSLDSLRVSHFDYFETFLFPAQPAF